MFLDGLNCQKWSKIIPTIDNGPKWSNIFQNGPKWLKIV